MTARVKLLHPPSTAGPSTDEPAPSRAGFVLYVGLDQDPADSPRDDLAEVAETLRDLARDLLPTAETFTALSLVPTASVPDEVGTLRDRLARLEPLPEHDASPDGVAPDGAAQHDASPDGVALQHGLALTSEGVPRPPGAPPPGAAAARAAPPDEPPASDPHVRVDLAARRVSVDGRPVRLTFMELELLAHLVRSSDRVVGREELLRSVWRGNGRPGTRTIDVHVRRLRTKVPDLPITTVRGVGYRVEPAFPVELTGHNDLS